MIPRLLAVLALCVAPDAALGQAHRCVPYADIAKHLKDAYGEVPAITGIMGAGEVLVIFVNPRTRSWTLGTRPANAPSLLCPRGSGTDLEAGSNINKPEL